MPDSDSDADILAFMRRIARTVFHPDGDCAMGPVVDARAARPRRRGPARRRRLGDAAVPRGNTNAPVIMVAEKAADLIRGLPPLPRAAQKHAEAGVVAGA